MTPRWTIIPPLARPTSPRQPWRRVASTTWRRAATVAQQRSARLAPWQCRGDGHQEQQGDPDRHGEAVEVRRPDDGAPVLQRFYEQREDRAEQDDEREDREQDVVGQEGAL